MRQHDQLASVAQDELLPFQLLHVFGHFLSRGSDQIGQVLMRELQDQNRAAIILHAEFLRQFQQGHGEPLPQAQPLKVRVPIQQAKPSVNGRSHQGAEVGEGHTEQYSYEGISQYRSNPAITERLGTERSLHARHQRRNAEEFTWTDQANQYVFPLKTTQREFDYA